MNAGAKPPTEITNDVAKNDTVLSPAAERQALIDGLNHDLAGEYQAILMYIHFSAKLTGPVRQQLRALFQAEIADEQAHAQFLSDKIAAMRGEPITEPRPVPQVSLPRQMVECALGAEAQAIADYTTRIGQAEACGEFGLKVELEKQLADETRHKDELERIIDGWAKIDSERTRSDKLWQDDGGQG